ncbi:hypothetical protein LRAMOSA02944 [Lichtheimia ramosa]|uniref:Phosphoinositide-specific phospholipase C EF-hand-like domain-containing protein n=1 Tax=Lichtheimia ramosa TaxID=688394 RepID=A0A077WT64_9FUNG|nr:hypothetical protein LRAMOSA02944 [Lichtheimia ramosa]
MKLPQLQCKKKHKANTNVNKERSLSPGSSTDREQPAHALGTPISMARLPVPDKQTTLSSFTNQDEASVEEITGSDVDDDDTQQVPVHDDTYSIPAANTTDIKQESSTLDSLMNESPMKEQPDDAVSQVTKSILNTTSDDIWGSSTNHDLPNGMKITRDLYNEYSIDESSLMHDQLFELLMKATDANDSIHQQADDIIQKYRQQEEDDPIDMDGDNSDDDMKESDHDDNKETPEE